MLIGVKNNIYAIRNIIRINSHSFKIMTIVHKNSNLSIMALSQRKIVYASTDLDDTIFLSTAIFSISNGNSAAIQTRRSLKLTERPTAIIGIIVTQGLNVFLMLISVFLVEFRFCQYRDVGLLTIIRRILNAYAITLIAFLSFKNISSFIKLAIRNA